MLIRIKNEIHIEKESKFELIISDNIKDKVALYWKEFIKGKEHYWDGDIITVSKIDFERGIIKVNKTKYSNLIYSKNCNEISINPLYTAILLKTSDNKYIIRKDIHNRLGLIGGMADLNDFKEELFIPEKCLKRELQEETNIDLYNEKQIISFKCKYVDINKRLEKYQPVGFVFVAKLALTSQEFERYMNITKTDGEIKELLFCTAEECINLKKKDDELTYLKELINCEKSEEV